MALIYASVVYLDRRMPNVLPANETSRFSEERTRNFLEKLTALGPRSSGSIALEVDFIFVYKVMLKLRSMPFKW